MGPKHKVIGTPYGEKLDADSADYAIKFSQRFNRFTLFF